MNAIPKLSVSRQPCRWSRSLKAGLMAVVLPVAFLAAGPSVHAQDYATTVIQDDPLTYWRFNQTSGSLINSATGPSAITVTTSQSVTILNGGIAGPRPSAWPGFASDNLAGNFLAGTTAHLIQISGAGGTGGPLNDALTGKAGVTLETWINPAALPASGMDGIFLLSRNDGGIGLRLNLSTNGINMGGRSQNGDTFASNNWALPLETGTWYHVAAVWDFSAKEMILYVNGTSLGAYSVGSAWGSSIFAVTNPNHYASLVGTSSATTLDNFFQGHLDEFAIYDRALSAETIAAHYAAASTIPEPSAAALLLGGCALFGLLTRRPSRAESLTPVR